jgi:hypothetical protein
MEMNAQPSGARGYRSRRQARLARSDAPVVQSIELHSIPTSQGRIAGYRIGNGRQRVLGTLRALRLLGGEI